MAQSAGARIAAAARVDSGWIAVAIAAAVAAVLIGPRIAPFVAVATTLCLLLLAPQVDPRKMLRSPPAPVAMLAGLSIWALLAVIWAADRGTGAGKALLLLLFTASVGSVVAIKASLPDEPLQAIARGCLIAFLLGLGFLCLEELTGHFIKRMFFGLSPLVRPSAKHIGVTVPDGMGEVFALAAHLTNRNMAAMSLVLWPMLLVMWMHVSAARRWLASIAVLAVAAVTIGLSQHDTSVLALIVGVPCALLCAWRPRLAFGLVTAGWLVATLLIVPITDWGYRTAQLHQVSWLPHTGRQRIILWGYTAEQVKKHPLLGVGTDSTKPLDASRGPRVETPPGHVYQLRTGPHAHNIYLQTWYELGLPGAALLCAFGLALLQALSRTSATARPFLLATFVSAAIMASLTWGLWQAWFMGAFAFTAILALLAAELVRRSGDPAAGA